MVAITTTLFTGLRKKLGPGSSEFLRAGRLFWIKKHGESPHFHQGRGFQSDPKQRQTAEGRESEASSAGPTALSIGGPYAARLSSRKVVRFDGPEVIQFLQGLVTNDVTIFDRSFSPPGGSRAPTSNQPSSVSPPIYTAMLTPQGRFLFDMFLYQPNQKGPNRGGSGPSSHDQHRPSLLADVDAESLDEFLGHLKKHRLRAKVGFEDFSSTCSAWARFAGPLQGNDGASEEVESGGRGYGGTGGAASESSEEDYQWCKDPRLGALGQRGLFPLHSTPPLVEAREEVGEEYYKMWRYEHGIPEGCSEIPKGEALPLEYNLDGVNAISFDKGCYIGQELTARTHFTGVIRKRIMSVQFLSPDGKEEAPKAAISSSEIVDVSGKRIGKVIAALGPRGLAHLRLETALNETVELRINGDGGAIVKPRRPKWWPLEWTHQARVEVR